MEIYEEDKRSVITARTILAPPAQDFGFECSYTYTISSDSYFDVCIHGIPYGEYRSMIPKIDLHIGLAKEFQHLQWFGWGPGKSYVDCKKAAIVACYESKLDDIFVPYIYPQESAMLSEVRTFSLCNTRTGLYIELLDTYSVCVTNYTIDAINTAQHSHELQKDTSVNLEINCAVTGLGSNSFGQLVLPKHQVYMKEFILAFRVHIISQDVPYTVIKTQAFISSL